mmetsp:Transcript_7159/g.24398  ORF Transcript_7159/g.24398 Transcript_7159/m.24398 type:complete len:214 (+) Transcript_7159:885-1526(+)
MRRAPQGPSPWRRTRPFPLPPHASEGARPARRWTCARTARWRPTWATGSRSRRWWRCRWRPRASGSAPGPSRPGPSRRSCARWSMARASPRGAPPLRGRTTRRAASRGAWWRSRGSASRPWCWTPTCTSCSSSTRRGAGTRRASRERSASWPRSWRPSAPSPLRAWTAWPTRCPTGRWRASLRSFCTRGAAGPASSTRACAPRPPWPTLSSRS